MLFELEGQPPRVIRAGEAFWEPGGDVIHYSDGNNRTDIPSKFTVTMMCVPGRPMLELVDPQELEQRRGPAVADALPEVEDEPFHLVVGGLISGVGTLAGRLAVTAHQGGQPANVEQHVCSAFSCYAVLCRSGSNRRRASVPSAKWCSASGRRP